LDREKWGASHVFFHFNSIIYVGATFVYHKFYYTQWWFVWCFLICFLNVNFYLVLLTVTNTMCFILLPWFTHSLLDIRSWIDTENLILMYAMWRNLLYSSREESCCSIQQPTFVIDTESMQPSLACKLCQWLRIFFRSLAPIPVAYLRLLR
jgi:hypothetical protein